MKNSASSSRLKLGADGCVTKAFTAREVALRITNLPACTKAGDLPRDVWGYDNPTDSRTVKPLRRRRREKIGAAARHRETMRGVGYRFTADAP